jgi:surface polysaccharide O-acyltransferase-like enzyme
MEKYSNKKSEKRYVLPLIIGCVAAIILLHGLYWNEFITLTKDTLFIALDLAGLAGFVIFGGIAYAKRNDPNFDKMRWAALLVAVFVCIWVGTWCSQYRMDKSDNIEYEYKKP